MSYDLRDYDPIHPRGRDWRGTLRRLFAPLVAAVVALAKFSFILVKFSSLFIAVGLYALFWGWKFAIGETSVVIAVSAPHRSDALAACRDAIDQLKERVPLWKKEVYAGGEEWIGRGS